MQLYRCQVRHAGKYETVIHKEDVTAADIVILKALHGSDAVTGVEATRKTNVPQAKERDRLIGVYGARVFARIFPGAMPRMPADLSQAGLTADGREIDAAAEDEGDEDAPAPEPSAEARAIAARVAEKAAKAGKSAEVI